MSLNKWKELAERRTKTAKAKRGLFDQITEERIKSKSTDQAIAKTFRLDKLDQIAEQTKPRKRVRIRVPRANREGGIDYAPDVDPYEDMDVEGLLNLEDYVAPEAEKQIAKIPGKPPQYEMDPNLWQIPQEAPPEYELPPAYEDPLPIEGAPEEEEEEEEEEYDEEITGDLEADKILDELDLPNYSDVNARLSQPDMTNTKSKNYLAKVVKDAETRRKQVIALKSQATRKFNKGQISAEQRDLIHNRSDKLRGELNDYIKAYKFKSKTYKGYGAPRRPTKEGGGAYFFHNPKEMLDKLTLILAEMKAGNTSIVMRNMGVTILDALHHAGHINKSQYGKLIKKYFR